MSRAPRRGGRRSPVRVPAPAPLREVHRITQRAHEPPRRWFSCENADLFVWSEGGRPVAFEFCYGKPADEHVVRWQRERGFVHARIDDGEATPLRNATPIVVADGRFDAAEIALAFEAVAGELEPGIVRLVLGALHRADG